MTVTSIKARPRRARVVVSIGVALIASGAALVAAYLGVRKFSEACE